MGIFNEFYKKEKPVFTGLKFGFGSGPTGPTGPSGPELSATGGTTYTPGNGYKYHLFTSSGSLVVASGSASVEYLVVAGGGSGGYDRGGGGGAGGLRSNSPTCPAPRRTPTLTLSAGNTYPVTVGSGGITQNSYSDPADLKGGNYY